MTTAGAIDDDAGKQFTLATYFNSWNKTSKFIFLVSGIMFFFGCHNYMQELIMHLPGFKVSRKNFIDLD